MCKQSVLHAMLVPIEQITPPTVIDDKICCHALTPVAGTNLYAFRKIEKAIRYQVDMAVDADRNKPERKPMPGEDQLA